MKGKLIVIEGLDGSGKATQAKHLAAALQQQGKQIREISFPNIMTAIHQLRSECISPELSGRSLEM